MTLLVAIAHPQYALLLSDRLLTSFTAGPVQHRTKVGVLKADDGAVLYGYTGLAYAGDYETGRWLTELFQEAGKKATTIPALLHHASECATEFFETSKDVKAVSPSHRRLLVAMVGFTANGQIIYCQMSNCTDPHTGKWLDAASDHFVHEILIANDMRTNPRMIRWEGTVTGIYQRDFDALDILVGTGKPIDAVVGKTVDVMRDIASRSESKGMIGRDILTGSLDARSLESASSFFPDGATSSAHMIDWVDVRSGGAQIAVRGMELTLHHDKFVDPRTPRRRPCPCGSGKPFRKCHGKTK